MTNRVNKKRYKCVVVSIVLLLTSAFTSGCTSKSYEPHEGPAERAGRYLDSGVRKAKDGTIQSYKRGKEWVKDTSGRISRGSEAFREEWKREDDRKYDNRNYEYRTNDDAEGYYRTRDPQETQIDRESQYRRDEFNRQYPSDGNAESFRWNERSQNDVSERDMDPSFRQPEPKFDTGEDRY